MESLGDITMIQMIKYIRNAFIHAIHVMEEVVQQVIIAKYVMKIISLYMKIIAMRYVITITFLIIIIITIVLLIKYVQKNIVN